MKIDDKMYLIFIFSLLLKFLITIFHIHWFCPQRNFKHSSWWRHKL